jgi:hypothetical protein
VSFYTVLWVKRGGPLVPVNMAEPMQEFQRLGLTAAADRSYFGRLL